MTESEIIFKDIADGFSIIGKAVGKQKEEAVAFVKNNHPWAWKALYYLLNPMMVYGIGSASLNKASVETPSERFSNIFEMLDYFNQKESIKHQDIVNVQLYIKMNAEYEWLIKGMLVKGIRLGISAKTVNKIEKGYIPTFSCMLANKYFDKPQVVEGKSFALTEKFDGIRCLTVVEDGRVTMYSRQGQIIDGMVDIEKELLYIYNIQKINFVLDGELLVTDRDNIPSKEQYKQTTNIVRKAGEKHGVTYHVFDYLSIDEFREQKGVCPYWLRRSVLDNNFNRKNPWVEVVPVLYEGNDLSQIMRQLNVQLTTQHEGIMINMTEAVYQFKRTNDLLKVKVMKDCDLRIVDIEEGSGKFAGTTGSLIVDYKGNTLGVGSGLSDEWRKEFWDHKEDYIGRVVSVQYFEETNDADGRLSLRFPVFLDLREEGKEVSYT